MELYGRTFSSSDLSPSAVSSQWQKAVDLLRLMKDDYQGARVLLERVSKLLANREALVGQQVQRAYLSSADYCTLRLGEYDVANPIIKLGNTILGEAPYPTVVSALNKIEVRCLGHFQVSSPFGRIGHWHSLKAKYILQYLLVKPKEPIVRDALMEAFWPEETAQTAGNNLKSAVHSLRLTLRELIAEPKSSNLVQYIQGSYRLNPEINLQIDVEEFEKHCIFGRRLEKENKVEEAIQEFEKAETLYQGDYLEDESYEEWTLIRREALKDSYLIILSKLAGYCLQTADYVGCIHYSQKMLSKDRCRQDAYRNLVCCYLKLGQRNRAVRWYEICCQATKAELDAVPDSKTTELYSRILKNEEV